MKLVNPREEAMDAHIRLDGLKNIAAKGTLTTLTGPRDAENTPGKPDTVVPRTEEIVVASDFHHELPPMSVQFLRVPGTVKGAAGSLAR